MKKRILALLMTALLVAGGIPAAAADAGSNKTTNTPAEGVAGQDNASGAKADKTTNDKTSAKESNTGKLSNADESVENVQADVMPIAITTLEELQKIGVEDGYPLNGIYELQNDIDAGQLTGLPNAADPGNEQETAGQENIPPITWNPIGTVENPFTGELRGNGHLILNLTIAPPEGDAAFFGDFQGTIKDLAFVNLHSVSKTGNAALLAGTMKKANVSNVLLNGKSELQNPDGTVYTAVDKKEAANVAARKTDAKTTESQGEISQNQAVGAQAQTRTRTECLSRNIAVEEKDCVYEQVSFIGELQGELPKGVSQIRTNPEYISMMQGEKEKLTAPELPFQLQFTAWKLEETGDSEEVKAARLELSDFTTAETEVTGKTAGKALLKAVYQYGETLLAIDVPVVVGEVINEVEELEPVDDVFYGQLEVVAELIPIDGVFPKWMKEKAPDINGNGEEKEQIQLFSWEDFKNIGNTDYNPAYTMDGSYILMNDIVSDGLPFTPIGTEENPFTGNFSGQNFMIDVTLNPEIDVNAEYKGLFGVVK